MTHVEEGKVAFRLNKAAQSNPYAMYSPEWAQWNQGWTCEQLNSTRRVWSYGSDGAAAVIGR